MHGWTENEARQEQEREEIPCPHSALSFFLIYLGLGHQNGLEYGQRQGCRPVLPRNTCQLQGAQQEEPQGIISHSLCFDL